MQYTESDNIINMTGALPTTDATGKVRLTEGEYLDLTSFDTSNVTNMAQMFWLCEKLTKITVSNKWVIGSSTNIVAMFGECGTDHVTVV